MRNTLFILMLFLTDALSAGEGKYICEIKEVYTLEPDGLKSANQLLDSLDYQRFVVHRSSGLVEGGQLENSRYDVTVISEGDSENSFQAYWVVHGSGNKSIRWIEVNEWVTEEKKPFRAVVQSWTYTGLCT